MSGGKSSDGSMTADRLVGLLFAAGLGLFLLIILVFGALAASLYLIEEFSTAGGNIINSAVEQGATLIALAIISFLVFVLIIVIMARILARGNLHNHPHALGLPAGSVRAIIAMAFLIFLAVMAVFSVQTAHGRFIQTGRVVEREINNAYPPRLVALLIERELLADHRDGVPYQIEYETYTRPTRDTAGNEVEREHMLGRLKVLQQEPAALEVSREVLTIIATALTAIVGFYFGSRSLADGVSTNTEPDTAQAELTARRVRNRLNQLVGSNGSVERKFREVEARMSGMVESARPARWNELRGEGPESYRARLEAAKKALRDGDDALTKTSATREERDALIEKMRQAIDDMQLLKGTLSDLA